MWTKGLKVGAAYAAGKAAAGALRHSDTVQRTVGTIKEKLDTPGRLERRLDRLIQEMTEIKIQLNRIEVLRNHPPVTYTSKESKNDSFKFDDL